MAISDEERHEIARKLRELPARAVYDMAITLHCLIWPPNITYTGIDQLFARLADLIDRPAIKPEPSGRAYWRCPRCGAFNYRSAVTDCCGVIPAHYCANCGAEIKDEMD